MKIKIEGLFDGVWLWLQDIPTPKDKSPENLKRIAVHYANYYRAEYMNHVHIRVMMVLTQKP